ncbi:MAG: exonuclease SbcD [Bacteriovoracaceae bacterium]|jgi:exonuclease SbcD
MPEFKIFHTSDWHLGKKLFKADRIEEHTQFLEWTYQFLISEKINLLIIAGDVFDVPNPPNVAQQLFYDFIFKIGKIPNFQSIVITGNHDSSSLFEIPKSFFQKHNCHIYTKLENDLSKLEHYIEYNNEIIGIKLLPYFRNYELTNFLPEASKEDDSCVENYFKNFFKQWQRKPHYKFLVSHHGFGKYSAAGSEHAIFLSGVDHFPMSWVENAFDYIALGHIHKKQTISKDPLTIYPGSPIPLRFSEGNKKYISLVTINDGKLSQEDIVIPVFKRVVQIKTSLDTYQNDIKNFLDAKDQAEKCFLEVIIKQDKPKAGVADKIRAIISNHNIELTSFIPVITSTQTTHLSFEELKQLNLTELFTKYYKHKYEDQQIPQHLLKNFNSLLEEINDENS